VMEIVFLAAGDGDCFLIFGEDGSDEEGDSESVVALSGDGDGDCGDPGGDGEDGCGGEDGFLFVLAPGGEDGFLFVLAPGGEDGFLFVLAPGGDGDLVATPGGDGDLIATPGGDGDLIATPGGDGEDAGDNCGGVVLPNKFLGSITSGNFVILWVL